MKLNQQQINTIRTRWLKDSSFLGFPDAERDSVEAQWFQHLLIHPHWFRPATATKTTLIVGRKGVGKTAARIAAFKQHEQRTTTGGLIAIEASADELAARHGERLKKAVDRGFGAVADWCQVYADLVIRHVASSLAGKLIIGEDEEILRKWATVEGISERDFGERLASTIASMVPWARKLVDERGTVSPANEERFQRVLQTKSFALYIDDFDNLQESRTLSNIRLIRDAVEAADRITHLNPTASVHLLMRQDLWLLLRPGWHYADKIAGLVELNWTQDDLRRWIGRRLCLAASTALGCNPSQFSDRDVEQLWEVFFPRCHFPPQRHGQHRTSLHRQALDVYPPVCPAVPRSDYRPS